MTTPPARALPSADDPHARCPLPRRPPARAPSRAVVCALAFLLALSACAPTPTNGSLDGDGGAGEARAAATGAAVTVAERACRTEPTPIVAVVDFGNTTAQYGTTVTGVEDAATARMITLLKDTGCYDVIERSVLLDLIAQQGLESLSPEGLARAAGAGYVITGVVTRATIARPRVSLLGVTVGQTEARVEVDVRVTDSITGRVTTSTTGVGRASSPNVVVSRIPLGLISFDDPTVGPLIAEASRQAIAGAVTAIRSTF